MVTIALAFSMKTQNNLYGTRVRKLSREAALESVNGGRQRCTAARDQGRPRHSTCTCGNCYLVKSVLDGIKSTACSRGAAPEPMESISTRPVSWIQGYLVGAVGNNVVLLAFTVTASAQLLVINLAPPQSRSVVQAENSIQDSNRVATSSSNRRSSTTISPIVDEFVTPDFLQDAVAVQPSTINASIVVSPGTLDFQAVQVGAARSLDLVVQNIGGSQTITGTVVTSPPFRIVAGTNYTLRANERQIVTVVFTPNSIGPAIGQATFAGGGNISVPLSGFGGPAGVAPPVSLRVLNSK